MFYRAFEHGLGTAWDAFTAPDALHALLADAARRRSSPCPLNTVFGVGVSLILARHRFPGAWLLDALVDIPLAISPVVIGLGAHPRLRQDRLVRQLAGRRRASR